MQCVFQGFGNLKSRACPNRLNKSPRFLVCALDTTRRKQFQLAFGQLESSEAGTASIFSNSTQLRSQSMHSCQSEEGMPVLRESPSLARDAKACPRLPSLRFSAFWRTTQPMSESSSWLQSSESSPRRWSRGHQHNLVLIDPGRSCAAQVVWWILPETILLQEQIEPAQPELPQTQGPN